MLLNIGANAASAGTPRGWGPAARNQIMLIQSSELPPLLDPANPRTRHLAIPAKYTIVIASLSTRVP